MDTKDRLSKLTKEQRALMAKKLLERRGAGAVSAGASAPSTPIKKDLANRFEPFPLTDLQQAYWVGRASSLDLGLVGNHSYFEVETDRDLGRLESSLNMMIERHDMLRCIIQEDGLQRTLREVPKYHIAIDDLSGMSAEERDEAIVRIRDSMSHQILPSDTWPLFKIRAARIDERTHRLFIGLDALHFDAWSLTKFLKEWSEVYDEPSADRPELDLLFRDYVLHLREQEQGPEFEKARDYWRAKVPQMPLGPELPFGTPPSQITEPRFERHIRTVCAEDWTNLKEKAKQRGLTTTSVLLAAYAEVLSFWSRSRNFTLNVPQFNRPPIHPQMPQVIGEFASFTLLECDLTQNDEKFLDRAMRHQQNLWEDLDHGAFNGIKVLRELALTRPTSGAVMPIIFTAAPQDGAEISLIQAHESLGRRMFAVNQSSQVYLDNHVSEHEGALVIDWDNIVGLFPEGMSEAILEAYVMVIEALARDDATWTKTWRQMCRMVVPQAEAERRSPMIEAPIRDCLVHDFALDYAQKDPEHIAVVSGSTRLSYGELLRQSSQWGHLLREKGAKPNQLVAIVMEKGWEQIVGAYAVVQAGAAYLPIDVQVPEETLFFILDNAEVDLVLTQSWLVDQKAWPSRVEVLAVDHHHVVEDRPGARLPPAAKQEDLAYVLYTSGSTGQPKGVMVPHKGLVSMLQRTNEKWEMSNKEVGLALTAQAHDMSVYDHFGLLGAGGTIVLPDPAGRRDPAHWSELMRRERVTYWNSVPAMMQMLLEYGEGSKDTIPDSLRTVMLGGDWIPLKLLPMVRQYAPEVRFVSVGGPTETSVWNIWYQADEIPDSWPSIPYGKPIPNARYYILNEALEHCPTWAVGEMHCVGVQVSRGYWKDEEKTAKKYFNHPVTGERMYATGDLGCFMPDGNIRFIGRADFQVKIQGQRIELGDIESRLAKHPKVKSVVTITVGQGNEARLAAYFVPEQPGQAPTPAELKAFLEPKLQVHMIPTFFIEMEALPLTRNGKVDRKALPLPQLRGKRKPAAPANGKAGAAAPSALGRKTKILDIVKEITQGDDIDEQTNLLGYGINSIEMVRIGNRLEQAFGLRPRIDQLFRLQTVDALDDYYEQNLGSDEASSDASLVPTSGNAALDAVIERFEVINEPAERKKFRASLPGVRKDSFDTKIALAREPIDISEKKWRRRSSYRQFSLRPVPQESFGRFLSCLAALPLDGKMMWLYPSGGGLYPVQTYIHVKPSRVEGVEAGLYYYHPVEHTLNLLSSELRITRDIHVPFINTPVFDEAAFSVLLVAQLAAIAPGYGKLCVHFSTLEAGIMAYAMELAALDEGLALCYMGSIEFDKIREHFKLDDSHVLLHSMVGGLMPNASEVDDPTLSITEAEALPGADKQELLLRKIRQLSPDQQRNMLLELKKAKEAGG